MNTLTVCPGFYCGSFDDECVRTEEKFYSICKKVLSFLYAQPKFKFSLFFTGPQLEWLEKKHPEFLILLEELVSRKQCEFLGGGYYDPLFPLIPLVDRVGQIELLTTAIRKTVGKRPRGAWLTESIWENSLITGLTTCGIEYVLLDNQLTGVPYTPLIFEDLGKTVQVLPLDSRLSADTNLPPDVVHSNLKQIAQNPAHSVICCFFDLCALENAMEKNWLDGFCNLIQADQSFEIALPSKYLKTALSFQKMYIPSGVPPSVSKHLTKSRQGNCTTVRSFLLEYPEASALYSRMMYTGMLISQFRGDKIRKKNARQELWKAQNCKPYWFLGTDGVLNRNLRQKCYKYLINAEKIIRGTDTFVDSVTSFDFDMDGRKEYAFQFQHFNLLVSPRGGAVTELDLMEIGRNYTDASRRCQEYDGISDSYGRKLFVDHFISQDQFEKMLVGEFVGTSVFPNGDYQEAAFDRIRHELRLKSCGVFGAEKQPVSLLKNYLVKNDTIQLQYVLKNESSKLLKGYFAVESNLSFPECSSDKLQFDAVVQGNSLRIDPCEAFSNSQAVSYLQLTDTLSGISFIYEPNEDSGMFTYPSFVSRPVNGVRCASYQATTVTFFWYNEIPSGRETEKTLVFSIKTPAAAIKKNRRLAPSKKSEK